MLRKTILKEHGSEKEPATEATMLSVPDVASVLVSSEANLTLVFYLRINDILPALDSFFAERSSVRGCVGAVESPWADKPSDVRVTRRGVMGT